MGYINYIRYNCIQVHVCNSTSTYCAFLSINLFQKPYSKVFLAGSMFEILLSLCIHGHFFQVMFHWSQFVTVKKKKSCLASGSL